jgi:hypothetical protein
MLLYLAIATVAVLFVAGVIAVTVLLLAAGTLYGENKAKGRSIVDARRREHRSSRELRLWQEKVLERTGAGTLTRRVYKENPDKPARRFVAPSQAVNELKQEHSGLKQVPPARKETVPTSIKEEFLEEAGASLAA